MFGSFGIQILSLVLAFGVTSTLTRIMTTEDFGLFYYVLVLISLIGLPLFVGLRNFATREIAISKSTEDWGRFVAVIRAGRRMIASYSVLWLVLGAAAYWFVTQGDIGMLLLLATPIVPFWALVTLQCAKLSGLGHTLIGQMPDALVRPAFLIAAAVAAWLVLGEPTITPETVILAVAVSAALAYLVFRPFVSRRVAAALGHREWRADDIPWMRDVLILSLVSGISYVNQRIDLLMIGVFLDVSDVAYYRISAQSAALVVAPQLAVNRILAPLISASVAKSEHARLQSLLNWGAIFASLGALPAALIFLVFPEEVLGLVFGPDYTAGGHSLMILTCGYLVSAALGSVGLALNMSRFERDVAAGMAVAALVNLILNIPLIHLYGIEGAAIATSASLIAWNLYLSRRVFRRLGVTSHILGVVWNRNRSAINRDVDTG